MSLASPSTSLPGMDLDALIQSLPACKRCRECRRGCDTFLPKCRQVPNPTTAHRAPQPGRLPLDPH